MTCSSWRKHQSISLHLPTTSHANDTMCDWLCCTIEETPLPLTRPELHSPLDFHMDEVLSQKRVCTYGICESMQVSMHAYSIHVCGHSLQESWILLDTSAFGHQEDLHGIEEPTTKSPCCSSPCRAKGFCTSQQRKVTEASHLPQWIIECWDGIWVVDTICSRVVSPLNAMICYDDIFKKGWFSGFILRSSAWNVTFYRGEKKTEPLSFRCINLLWIPVQAQRRHR